MKTCSAFTRLVAGWSVLNGGLCFIPRTLTTGGGVHIRQSTTVDKVPSLDQGQVLRAATGSWFDQVQTKSARSTSEEGYDDVRSFPTLALMFLLGRD